MEIDNNKVTLDILEYEEMHNYMERLKETVDIMKDTKLVKDLIQAEKDIENGDFLTKEEFFS